MSSFVKRIGYAKFGRTMKFDKGKWGFQGDAEAPNLLFRLAKMYPHIEWVVVGHNSHNDFPEHNNITNPWYLAKDRAKGLPALSNGKYATPFKVRWHMDPGWWCSETSGFEDYIISVMSELDGLVMHLGQHGTSHISIPQSKSTWAEARDNPDEHATHTYDWAKAYGRYLVRGMNVMGDLTDGESPVVYLCTDPRNFHKIRDVKWPSGTSDILAQNNMSRIQRHERFEDTRSPDTFSKKQHITTERDGELWLVEHGYVHAGLELMILPDDWHSLGRQEFEDRDVAGITTTSFSAIKANEKRRSEYVRDWLLPAFPGAKVYGKWDKKSLEDVPSGTVIQNNPSDFHDLLGSFRVTMSLPAVGSGWSAAKPYQCFATRTVCFFVHNIDEQGYILPSRRKTDKTIEVADGLYSIRPRHEWTNNDLMLAQWLRVEDQQEFMQRARAVSQNKKIWTALVNAQTDLLARRWNAQTLEHTIGRRLHLHD